MIDQVAESTEQIFLEITKLMIVKKQRPNMLPAVIK